MYVQCIHCHKVLGVRRSKLFELVVAYDGSLASSGGTGVCEYMYVPVESRFLNTVLVDGRFLTGDIRVPSYIDVPTPSSKNI